MLSFGHILLLFRIFPSYSLLIFLRFISKSGNTMSLIQHGSHTARKRNIKIGTYKTGLNIPDFAIMI